MHPCLNWFILIYRMGASYVKSIANSAIEIARIKSLEDGVGPGAVSIVRIDFYDKKITFPAKLLFTDAIRNGIMIQMHESLVVNGLTGLK